MLQRHFPCLAGAVNLHCGYAFHQEKEKLYVELKHILARQPGPEAAEQLQIYRQTLQQKTKQLKVSNLCFPGQTLGNAPEQVCCLSSRSWFPKCPTPPRSALLAPYSQEEQSRPQSYPSAPRLIDPTILHLPKEGSEQVGRESGRR